MKQISLQDSILPTDLNDKIYSIILIGITYSEGRKEGNLIQRNRLASHNQIGYIYIYIFNSQQGENFLGFTSQI